MSWRLTSGVVLERTPVILPWPEPWEEELLEFQKKHMALAYRNSKGGRRFAVNPIPGEMFEDGVARIPPIDMESLGLDLRRIPKMIERMHSSSPTAEQGPTDDSADAPQQRAILEKVLPRVTEDDEVKNLHSTYRELDKRLFLVVRKRGRKMWQFPQTGFLKSDASLKDAAMRVLDFQIGFKMRHQYFGHGPIGHHEFLFDPNDPYKPQLANDYGGAKVFFYHAIFLEGIVDIDLTRACEDYAWVTKQDLLNKYFADQPSLKELCQDMLWD